MGEFWEEEESVGGVGEEGYIQAEGFEWKR
jgi:hypothetical protein